MNSFTHGASPVKVAIVGLGRATFSEHVPYFEGARDLFKVVAACDVSRERRTMLAKSFPKCKMFRRYDDMLDERDIELVLVATPTENHLGQAVAALQRKFWTVVETPMATTHKGALQLKGSSAAADHKLLPLQRGVFAPDFMAAAAVARDERIGMLHGISIRKCDYIRRNDWCTVKRLGGGALLCEATDMFVQILRLLPVPPVQLWSETKRIAATGDTEDYFHVRFKTRSPLTADVEYDGGCMLRGSIPSFAIKGDRGFFYIMPGIGAGELTAVAPGYKFPRRRSSVRTPPLRDMHEQFPESTFRISAPAGTEKGIAAFWSAVFSTVRNAAPFPIQIEESCDAIRLACIIKESSVFRS